MTRVALIQGKQQWARSSSSSSLLYKVQSERQSFVSCAPTETDDSTVASFEEQEQKAVQFDEKVVEIIIDNVLFDARNVWYSQSELNGFRIDAEQQALIAQKKQSTIRDLMTAFSVCTVEKKQQSLNTWACKDFRGLEEYANPQYSTKRNEVQQMLWAAVLEAQGLNATPEELCEISLQFSRAARCFAQYMGRADMNAALSPPPRRSLLKGKSFIKRNWRFGKPKASCSA
mmetsp:Transcript_13835/g.20979  ORF Transcript_13835/g.20979 Transcript_13835/m.20979 type:complete len:230 (-) Transcript_13835:427-1116(-)